MATVPARVKVRWIKKRFRDWCVALGISEKGGAKIVQKFETDILGFLELSNWGRNNSGAGSHAELSEESFRKQLTLIKVKLTDPGLGNLSSKNRLTDRFFISEL